MDVICADVVDDGCQVVITGTTAHHLAAEIVAHTGHTHPQHIAGMSDDEVTRHHARVLRRIEDMLAGGPGTPV